MSSYLQPITKPEATYTIHVKRFNPESNAQAHWETYRIPFVRTMTVIQALEYLWDQNNYLAFRANCREMTCGSCAMLINGAPGLACMTLLQDGSRIEPLANYSVLKDLIVDTSGIERKYKELEFWPKLEGTTKISGVPRSVLHDYSHIYSRCIECYVCLEACPQSDAETTQFDGPMFMLQIARLSKHPLDAKNRPRQAIERGALSCVNCYECASVCPVGLSPASEIGKLRRRAFTEDFRNFWRKLVGKDPARTP